MFILAYVIFVIVAFLCTISYEDDYYTTPSELSYNKGISIPLSIILWILMFLTNPIMFIYKSLKP